MKAKIKSTFFFIPNILIVLFIGLVVRLLFSPFGTLSLDQNTFIGWSNSLVNFGFAKFYLGWSDYLPGYMYVLWLLGKLQGFIPQVVLYKLPAILADLITGYFIWKIVSKEKNEKWGIVASSLYVFNPAIIGNSTLWGQVDSITGLFVILAIYLANHKFIWSAALLAIGTLVKPQVPFIVPAILVLALIKKWSCKKLFLYGLIVLGVFILGFFPFVTKETTLFPFVLERIKQSLSQYPYGSVNAFNFLGLWGFWQKNPIFWPPQIFAYLILGITSLIYVVKKYSQKFNPYVLAAILLTGTFLFFPRMHERHLLPALAPLLVASASIPSLILVYLGFSVTYVLNLLFSFNWINENFAFLFPPFLIKLIIIFNLALFVYLVRESLAKTSLNIVKMTTKYFVKLKTFFKPKRGDAKQVFSKSKMSPKITKILLGVVLAFSLVARLLFLGNPPKEYFDEVYHAFTAKQMLVGNPAAWEWWNTPPEGFAYEWTHPPLAKLGMWLSMSILGENAFGWRFPEAILGVVCVYLVFVLAKELFKDNLLALMASGIFSLDGLVLSMSRIGMNDTYLLTFTLLTLILFLKKKNFWASLAFGLAIASKWSAVWLIPVLSVIFLGRRLKFKASYLWFLIIPALVYLATYIPMFLSGHSLDIFWGMQKQMWWYHTGLKATHAYSSFWWSWPLLIRPVYLYTSDEIGGMVGRIYNLGNPVVFWFGLVSVVISFVYSFVEKNKILALTIFSYLVFFVSWAASPRIMFFYHYLPAVPFLCIITAYVLRKNPKYVLPIFGLALLSFVYFYPHWTGIQIPLWLDTSYYWISSWR